MVFLHRRVTGNEIETHNSPDFQVGEDSALHPSVHSAHTNAQVERNGVFRDPAFDALRSRRSGIGRLCCLHKQLERDAVRLDENVKQTRDTFEGSRSVGSCRSQTTPSQS